MGHRVLALFFPLLLLVTIPIGPGVRAAPSLSPDRSHYVWPAVARSGPFLLGAVEAFRVPHRADEIGVRWQRVLFLELDRERDRR